MFTNMTKFGNKETAMLEVEKRPRFSRPQALL